MEDKNITKDSNLNENVDLGEMVTTLDGRVVNKKDVKIGEIYINAEGKKVRKVVKKVIRTTIAKKESSKQSGYQQHANEMGRQELNRQANGSVQNSVNSTAAREMERPGEKSLAMQKAAERKGVAENALKDQETETKMGEDDKRTFLERVNSKHAFLDKIKRNERIGSAPVVAATETPEESPKEVEEFNEDVAPDKSVAALETAVVGEAYGNSIGMGSSYATGAGGPESKVSGAATNPNASPTAILSQSGNPISQSLAGNSLPQPINKSLPKTTPKKKRKPIKLWIPTVVLASAYVLACLIYFVTGYNFGDKSIDVGKYYIAVGDESKKEYYDGQKFNFYELIMTYYWSQENVEEYDLTKFHMVEPTNSMGYTLNNGYINGIWDGEYAKDSVAYRDVKVKFLYKEETCYVPVRIYKNVLTSLNCYSSIRDLNNCKAGDQVAVTVFGVYTNKVMVDEGIKSIERKMDLGEYELWIHLYREDTRNEGAYYYRRQKLEFNEETKTYTLPRTIENFTVRYKDTVNAAGVVTEKADDIKITANSVNDYDIQCYTYDKYGVETFDKIQNPSMNKDDKPFKVMTINSQLSAKRSEQVSARFNEPFTFSIKPNEEQGYTLRAGYSVLYNIMDSDENYIYAEFKELEEDNLGNYRIEREEISGRIIIKVIGCSNTYNATFYVKDSSSADYRVYQNLSIIKGGQIVCPTAPVDTTYFKFLGWAERYENGELGEIIGDEDWSSMVMGTSDRTFEAQYEYAENIISYVSAGYEITDLEGNPISSIKYGETLTFKLKLKTGYSFGGENVTLYYKTENGSLQQIYVTGHTTSKQYDEDDRYIINGELLTGNLTFDLNMLYRVSTEDNKFTFDEEYIRKTVGSSTLTSHIKITLKPGITAPAGEVPGLLINGIAMTHCPVHSDAGRGIYCYYINRNEVKDNASLEINNVIGQYNIVKRSGDEQDIKFEVMTEEYSQKLITAVIEEGRDLRFTVVAAESENEYIKYDLSSATVVAKVNGIAKTLYREGDIYILRHADFGGLTTDIVIEVSGITEIPVDPEEEPGEPVDPDDPDNPGDPEGSDDPEGTEPPADPVDPEGTDDPDNTEGSEDGGNPEDGEGEM